MIEYVLDIYIGNEETLTYIGKTYSVGFSELDRVSHSFKANIRISQDAVDFLIRDKCIVFATEKYVHGALNVVEKFLKDIYNVWVKAKDPYFTIKMYKNEEEIASISCMPRWYRVEEFNGKIETTDIKEFISALRDFIDSIVNEIRMNACENKG